jgi:hypothetical protein
MTDRPIIFSAPMIRALLAGRKTQTRRIAKLNGRTPTFGGPKGQTADPNCWGWEQDDGEWILLKKDKPRDTGYLDLATIYQPGDRLWVREAWGINDYRYGGTHPIPKQHPTDLDDDHLSYLATESDAEIVSEMPYRPSIHMPRWASRLTLIVEAVKVERLTDISEADAQAEGVEPVLGTPGVPLDRHYAAFMQLWDRLHGEGATYFNPWVVAVTFRVVRANIDAVPA